MAKRTKSSYVGVNDAGRITGHRVTDTDRTRLLNLARWHALSVPQLARLEVPRNTWYPGRTGLADGEVTDEFVAQCRAVSRRLATYARIATAGSHSGPWAQSVLTHTNEIAWYATLFGATVADLPWRMKATISPHSAAHAMFAADVGLQLESFGLRVYSQREHTTRYLRDGSYLSVDYGSVYETSEGTKIRKEPDVVIPAEDGASFVAVEAERDQGRPISTYVEKLVAYDNNPAIFAVWYMCASPATAGRVARAVAQVFEGRESPVRIRVAPQIVSSDGKYRWRGFAGLGSDGQLLADLGRAQPSMMRAAPAAGRT